MDYGISCPILLDSRLVYETCSVDIEYE